MLPRDQKSSRLSKDQDLIDAVERELRHIGDELHDNLCQTLAGTSMVMETIGRAVAAGKPVSPEALRNLRSTLETAITQTRGLSRRFNPEKLAETGLMATLNTLAQETPNCEFVCERPVIPRDPKVALALLRIAQEAVRNAVEHSGAERIRITLKQSSRNITLRITDNGCGFAVEKRNGHISGLHMMHRRAEAIQGRLRATSRQGLGTTITCTVPWS